MSGSGIPIDDFDRALEVLATGPGGIKQRLLRAWIAIVSVPETMLPAGELRQQYLGLLDAVSYRAARGEEGRLAATIGRMSEDEAVRCARDLLRFWLKLRAAAGVPA